MPDEPNRENEDPFLKVQRELEAMEIPQADETLEERLRRKIAETQVDMTPDEEIERRARSIDEEIARAARPEIPEVPDFEARLRNLEGRATETRIKRNAEVREQAKKNASDAKSAKGLGIGLTVAYMIIGFPLVGALFGWLIDKSTNSNAFIAFGTVGGAALGVVAAILIINRHSSSL
jgi:F0F1-type ATP synthase assembly protein I